MNLLLLTELTFCTNTTFASLCNRSENTRCGISTQGFACALLNDISLTCSAVELEAVYAVLECECTGGSGGGTGWWGWGPGTQSLNNPIIMGAAAVQASLAARRSTVPAPSSWEHAFCPARNRIIRQAPAGRQVINRTIIPPMAPLALQHPNTKHRIKK